MNGVNNIDKPIYISKYNMIKEEDMQRYRDQGKRSLQTELALAIMNLRDWIADIEEHIMLSGSYNRIELSIKYKKLTRLTNRLELAYYRKYKDKV